MSLTTQPEHATSAQYDPLIPAEFRTGADGKNNPYYVDFSDEIDAIYDLADELAGESVSRSIGTMQGAFAAMANAAGADPQVDANAPVEESIRAMSGKLGGSQPVKVWVSFDVNRELTNDPLSYFTAAHANLLGKDAAISINFVEDSTYAGDDFVGYYECPVGEVLLISPAEDYTSTVNSTFVNGAAGLFIDKDSHDHGLIVLAGPDFVEETALSRSVTIRIEPVMS